MAKAKKVEKQPEEINGFVLCNADKLYRVIHGSMGAGGMLTGGLGEDATPEAILAEYDRNGGLIRTAEGEKVITGSFYDFKAKAPRKVPQVQILRYSPATAAKNTVENVSGPQEGEKPSKKAKKQATAADADPDEE